MLKRISILIQMLTLTLTAGMLGSCSDEETYNESQSAVYQMVTFTGDSESGATFDYVLDNDNGAVHLYAPKIQMSTAKYEVGDRLIIRYLPVDGDLLKSGEIKLTGYIRVINSELTTSTSEETDDFKTSSTYLLSMWRTGDYLNYHGKVYYVSEPDTLAFTVDRKTLEDEYPVIHMIYEPDSIAGGTVNSIYASVNVSSLIGNEKYKGFKVQMDNTNGTNNNEITFNK